MREDLTSKDYLILLETVELAYSIPDRAALVHAIFEKLEKWIGISSAAFIPFDTARGNFDTDGYLHNSPEGLISLFSSHYAPLHPFICKEFHLNSPNEVVRLSDISSMPDLADSEWGRDFQPLTPLFYELSMMLGSQGDHVAGMCVHRKRHDRDFSAREMRIVELLLPHLARACQNISLMEGLASSRDIGLIIMGSDDKPSYINDRARRALNRRSLSMVPNPDLSPHPTYLQTEQGPYRVRTKKTSGIKEKTIFLEPTPSRTNLSSKLACFGLTPRQAEIALHVIWGFSNREIAEKVFITEQTVKDHLRDIFEKMKIHRRSEVGAKVLGLKKP